MEKDLMEQFYAAINQGVEMVDKIRAKSTIQELQMETSKIAKEINLPGLVHDILENHPEKRTEIQRRIIAFMGEGKRLEDSLIR